MKIFTWIVQALLALNMLVAGGMKLAMTREELIPDLPWAADFSPMMIKAIAALEVLGALGLLLPYLLKKFKNLVPLSAIGIGIIMIGAVATHVMRSEMEMTIAPLALALMAAFVAYRRKDLMKG